MEERVVNVHEADYLGRDKETRIHIELLFETDCFEVLPRVIEEVTRRLFQTIEALLELVDFTRCTKRNWWIVNL